MKNKFKKELWTPILPENQPPKVSRRSQIKILLKTSETVEEADEVISKNFNFKSVRE